MAKRGPKPADLRGRRYGRLRPLEIVGAGCNGTVWLCRCDCGKETRVPSGRLLSGNTLSCGCLFRDLRRQQRTSNRNRAEAMYRRGMTCAQIAAKLGVTKQRVQQYLAGVIDMRAARVARMKAATEARDRRIAEAIAAGQSREQVAAEFGLSDVWFRMVLTRLRRRGFDIPKLAGNSDLHPSTLEMIRRRDEGQTIAQIAAAMGRTENNVRVMLFIHTGSSRQAGRPPYRRRAAHA